jgi:hypothetical protein
VDPYGEVTAKYTLAPDAVLWVAVCPPKGYDWERSIRDHVVWHWSRETGYPTDADLTAWSKEGNIVLLQSEVMLWKDWNLAFEPRLGEAEFARVRETMHRNGQRFIVYTSPSYFFRGTPFEQYAFNSFEGFTGWPPARGVGDNIDEFMAAITKVMQTYRPDGLYFDGQYFDSAPALYALARRTRALLGEEGILEWHSTTALGSGTCYLPQADAYVDFILRGEGQDGRYGDASYLRYFVSGFNASNSIGVICNNGGPPTAELIDRLLEMNCRMHTIAGWLSDPKVKELVDTYKARLTPELREQVLRGVDEREAHVAEEAKALEDETRALMAPPAWSTNLLFESFDALPKWNQAVSPADKEPFAIEDGALMITAKAHTYAYLTAPVAGTPNGVMVKIRQHTDGGMSWGPAVFLRWKNGARLRLGVRSDGRLQTDIGGEQQVFGSSSPEDWVWLRARWLSRRGVIERSADGITFETVRIFEHGGSLSGPLETVSVGKVPYSGEAQDHSEAGEVGTCYLDNLVVY